MKRKYTFISVMVFLNLLVIFLLFSGFNNPPQYILLAWNDLGMHYADKSFSKITLMPPHNNVRAQAIQVGAIPTLLTSGYHVTYEVPGNTYSVGKTDFWTYAQQLFGVTLADNIGLTGAGLSGTMTASTDYFKTDGIPLTPYQDTNLNVESPFQLGLFKLYDSGNNLIASTQNVIPVSGEINCVSSGCHSSEQSIMDNHSDQTLTAPVLCAHCHADNALGTTGNGEAPIFSRAIHSVHGSLTNDCYKCHPGPNTQFYRDAMLTNGFTCQDCHGSVSNVASTISSGRQPWLQEPSCTQTGCHASQYAPNTGLLYKDSKGHGNLYCSACHGSPHAITPTNQENDNLQNFTLQGYNGTLDKCDVCHGYTPSLAGPHGIVVGEITPLSGEVADCDSLLPNYPNPVGTFTTFRVKIKDAGKVNIEIYNITGQKMLTILHRNLNKGVYEFPFDTRNLSAGSYIVKMTKSNFFCSQNMIIL
ncbi:MAG: T9SS type A sorting domain-containing protein [Bacteroidia bacterium]|nr:T9SS type A sorting domain-containing protein [Bacteroidia bacterium]